MMIKTGEPIILAKNLSLQKNMVQKEYCFFHFQMMKNHNLLLEA